MWTCGVRVVVVFVVLLNLLLLSFRVDGWNLVHIAVLLNR